MSQGEPPRKAKTATERSREYRQRKRLGISLVRSPPKASLNPPYKMRLCKRFAAAKQESLFLKSASSSSSTSSEAVDSLLRIAEARKQLRENDDGLFALDHMPSDILEPICSVSIKEEPLKDGLSAFDHVPSDILEPICTVFIKEEPLESADRDACISQEKGIDPPSLPVARHFQDEKVKVKKEEEEEDILDCHAFLRNLNLPVILPVDYCQDDRMAKITMENIHTYTLREKLEAVMKGTLLLPPKQPAMTAAERVRRFRARQRGLLEEDCSVNVRKTPLSRKTTQFCTNGKSHAVKPSQRLYSDSGREIPMDVEDSLPLIGNTNQRSRGRPTSSECQPHRTAETPYFQSASHLPTSCLTPPLLKLFKQTFENEFF